MARQFTSLAVPKYLKAPFQLLFLISSSNALFLLISFFKLQPVVPIFYSLADSSDYLVDKRWLILFPFVSFLITISHLFLIKLLYKHQKIIPILFAWCTVVVEILLFLELIRITLIIS